VKSTTVIPAYKSQYLLELLACLVQQTEAPDQIIFSDDSPDESFIRILNSEPVKSMVAHLNISVIKGPRKGGHANFAQCIRAWGGRTELLHILCDDDIVYPHFYAQHRLAHRSGTFSSSVSRRWYANEAGQPVRQGLNVPEIVADHPQKMISLDVGVLFATTVGRVGNWLGEVSNTVMRAEVAELIIERQYDGIYFAGLEDLGAFVCGAVGNPLCFINEHLGFFRQSASQNSAQTMAPPLKCAVLAYIALSIIGRNAGLLSAQQVHHCVDIIGQNVLWHYRDEADLADMRQVLPDMMAGVAGSEARFLACWNDYIAKYGIF
jgi:hypothetical protein